MHDCTSLHSGSHYHGVFERMAWDQTPAAHLALVILFALGFVGMILFAIHSPGNMLVAFSGLISMAPYAGTIKSNIHHNLNSEGSS